MKNDDLTKKDTLRQLLMLYALEEQLTKKIEEIKKDIEIYKNLI